MKMVLTYSCEFLGLTRKRVVQLEGGKTAVTEYGEDGCIKRRFIYAAGIDEPVCMVVEPDHQGYYGLEEYSNIAYSWLCDPNDTCFDPQADYYADSFIDIEDILIFANDYYLQDRPPLTDSKYYGYVFDGMSNVVAMTYCNDPNQTGDPNEMPYFIESYVYDPLGDVTIYNANGLPLTQSAIGNPYMFISRLFEMGFEFVSIDHFKGFNPGGWEPLRAFTCDGKSGITALPIWVYGFKQVFATGGFWFISLLIVIAGFY